MNKKNSIWILILMICSSIVSAQPDDMDDDMDESRKEKIESLKRAFISDKLELTVAQSEKFWPMYNEFNASRKTIRKNIKDSLRKTKESVKTDAEFSSQVDLIGQKRKEEIDLESKFIKDCLPLLGVEKSMKLMGLEKEFQRELMDRIRERRQDERHSPPSPGDRRKN